MNKVKMPNTFLIILVPFLTLFPQSILGKNQYVQPLNMGMQVSIPYDIANIFNRPINFGPIASVISVACFLYIIFFGVITSPFGYFFGVPSEKYVLGDAWKTLPKVSRSFQEENVINSIISPSCKEMVLCSAHQTVKQLPLTWLKGYQFFSKRIHQIPSSFKAAIFNGLVDIRNGEVDCEELFSENCGDSLFGILVRETVSLVPKWMRTATAR